MDDALPKTSGRCRKCGACCRTFPIFASDDDARREERIRSEALELKPWLKSGRWAWQLHPLPFHERCCFLDEEARCAIYVTRPQVCREFASGSAQCLDARRRAGLGETGQVGPEE